MPLLKQTETAGSPLLIEIWQASLYPVIIFQLFLANSALFVSNGIIYVMRILKKAQYPINQLI